MYTRVNEPQSIGGVLDSGFKLFRAGVRQIVPITYLGALIAALATWVLQTALIGQINAAGQPVINMPLAAAAYIMMIVLGSIFMAAAIYRIKVISSNDQTTFGSALTMGLRRAPALIGASILYMLATVLGMMLLIIPGLYLSVMFAFAFYAVPADKKGPLESIKYSHMLVKGSWWRTTAVLTIMILITFVFYIGIGLVAAMFIATGDAATELLTVNVWSDIIIIPVLTAVMTALLYCLGYAVYEDLKLRREGTDLAERIESLESA